MTGLIGIDDPVNGILDTFTAVLHPPQNDHRPATPLSHLGRGVLAGIKSYWQGPSATRAELLKLGRGPLAWKPGLCSSGVHGRPARVAHRPSAGALAGTYKASPAELKFEGGEQTCRSLSEFKPSVLVWKTEPVSLPGRMRVRG